ncbi:Uma2 family endonuclease [Roseomonas sp. GCM10028921]
MNTVPGLPTTLGRFIAWEQHQDLRHEFDGTKPVAMTGGSAAHAAIQRNLALSVGGRLRGRPCQFYGSALKILTATTSRLPDGLVTCTKVRDESTVAPDPVVIFEVLSPETASYDMIVKNMEYSAIPSVHRYIMLEQELIGATVFLRSGDDWIGTILSDGARLCLPEIDIELPLAELYEGLDPSSLDAPSLG